MKLVIFLALISCAVGSSDISCILYGNACPTGSTCTPTEVCQGQCISVPTLPPVIPCSIGDNGPCGTASSCTPTMPCPPSPTSCGGQCIAIPTYPPVVSCTIGANDCPSSSFCTPVMTCKGLCISTPTSSPTPTSQTSMTITSAQPSASTTSCTDYSASACPSEYSPCCAYLCGHAQVPFLICQATSQSGPLVGCDACPMATATTASTSTRSGIFGSTTITGVNVITVTEYAC